MLCVNNWHLNSQDDVLAILRRLWIYEPKTPLQGDLFRPVRIARREPCAMNNRTLSPAWTLFILTGLNLFNYLDRYVVSALIDAGGIVCSESGTRKPETADRECRNHRRGQRPKPRAASSP